MTVYVVQRAPGRDITSAKEYGDLKNVIPFKDQIALSSMPVVFQAQKTLRDFCDDDYLLLMGDPSIIGVCCAIASKHNNGKFKVLKWDRESNHSLPIEFKV